MGVTVLNFSSNVTTVAPVFHVLATMFLLHQDEEEGRYKYQQIQPWPSKQACLDIYNNKHCFSMESPWVGPERPEAMVPWDPALLDTTFTLVTQANKNVPVKLDPRNLNDMLNAPVIRGGNWKILVHGFQSGMDRLWVKKMVRELLFAEDQNVILVDWSKGATIPYQQAIANIRLVGVQMAYFIYYFHKFADVSMDKFHMIGHSLGAHACGYTGAHLKEFLGITLSRITALDPAHPSFENSPPIIRLDPFDAEFVDVIHSDNNEILGFPLTLGLSDAVGHVDFFPNGGKKQPGCDYAVGCAHTIVLKYFTESIRHSCPFLAVSCANYTEFQAGRCWGCEAPSECIEMGLHATPPETQEHLSLFLLTKGGTPYCGYHYRITIEMSNSTDMDGEFGVVSFGMKGVLDSIPTFHLTDSSIFYDTGKVYHYITLGPDTGDVMSLEVTFLYPSTLPFRIVSRRLHMAAISIEKLGDPMRWRYCFESETQNPDVKHVLNQKHRC